jgi:hypothetical protein
MIRILAGAALIAAFLCTPFAHAVIIDTFDTSQSLSADMFTDDFGSVAGGGILGGERDSVVIWDSGPNTVDVEVNAGSSGLLNFSSGAATIGYADFIWDGLDGSDAVDFAGLGGVDLTAGGTLNAIALNVAFDDLPVEVGMSIATDAGNFSSASLNLPGGIFTPQSYSILFSAFVPDVGAGADFTNVNAILLWIQGELAATDVQLDFIESAYVPEPSSLILAAFGCIGFAAWGWRRRKHLT